MIAVCVIQKQPGPPAATAANASRSRSGRSRANRHGRDDTLWGEHCQQHPGECVGNSQGGPEAEISVWRQCPAHYQEQDAEREGQQEEQPSPANAGAPPSAMQEATSGVSSRNV
jgi:hypothetical protein